MIKCRFKMLVFQNGKVDQEVVTETHEFTNGFELGRELVKFAAKNSSFRTDPLVKAVDLNTKIREPGISKGLGPETYLVISEIIPVK